MNERSLFLAAAEIPDAGERAAYLERACGGDPALRGQIEALLAAHDRTGPFMDVSGVGADAETLDAPAEGPGSRVGPYKLLQKIGQGGMGVVYMAEQEEPVRRMVALKIIRGGIDTAGVLARFEAERQALALMDHPNIARVLDAGTTDAGRPYFAMELVKGAPMTQFCDQHQLTLRERLELFVPVCQAIQHAHQKGVIHRDIKPSNVLVALYDDRPVPKVIDFGVAKATSRKLTDRTLFTHFGTVVGTLEYMSPEQARLNQLDVDTRSDVYSLGVLLYELLTGGTPLDRTRLKAAALDEVLRLIREEEAPRPSTRLGTAQAAPSTPAGRRADAAELGRMVRGELDWIVMKALEKDRARRYETANGLARDVERYLRDEAVEACPPTFGYRLHKLYRKNRAAVGVAAAFLLLLSTAAVTATFLAVRAVRAERRTEMALRRALRDETEANAQRAAAEQARRKAERETQRAEREKLSAQAVRDFLQIDLLQQAAPLHQAEMRRLEGGDYSVQRDPTIRELLDRAAQRLATDRIEARFPGMPVVQADVLATVGETYMNLMEDARGVEMLGRAVEKYRASLGDDHPATIQARQDLAEALFWSAAWAGREEERQQGLALMEAVCEARIRVQGRDHPDAFTCRERLGGMYLSVKGKDSIPYLTRLRDDALRVFGVAGFHSLYATHDLSEALLQAGRPADAVKLLEPMREILGADQRIPLDHPYAVRGHCTLARAYEAVGQPGRAVELLRPVYDYVNRNPDASPSSLFELAVNLERSLRKTGRTPEAVEMMERALALAVSIGREKGRGVWQMRHQLAWTYVEEGKPEAALALFRTNLDVADTPEQKGTTLESISRYYERKHQDVDALKEIREALDVHLRAFGPDHHSWRTGMIRTRIGQTLLRLGKPSEAEPFLLVGYEDMVDHLGDVPDHDRGEDLKARTAIVDFYKATNRAVAVRPWAESLVPKLEKVVRSLQDDGKVPAGVLARAVVNLGLAYLDAGRPEDAARVHGEAIRRLEAGPWPGDPDVAETFRTLRVAVFATGREDLGRAMRQTTLDTLTRLPDVPRDTLAREYFSAGFQELGQARRHDEAISYFRKAVETLEEVDRGAWNVTKYRLFLGEALFRGERHAEAEPVLRQAFEESVRRIAKAPAWEKHFPNTAARFLAELCTATGRPDEAKTWEAERAKHPAREPQPAPAAGREAGPRQ